MHNPKSGSKIAFESYARSLMYKSRYSLLNNISVDIQSKIETLKVQKDISTKKELQIYNTILGSYQENR